VIDNVTKLSEHSLLNLIVSRRREIKERMEVLRQQDAASLKEGNFLWHEDRELDRAEKTIRKSLEKK
jgi:hypothetical protein